MTKLQIVYVSTFIGVPRIGETAERDVCLPVCPTLTTVKRRLRTHDELLRWLRLKELVMNYSWSPESFRIVRISIMTSIKTYTNTLNWNNQLNRSLKLYLSK